MTDTIKPISGLLNNLLSKLEDYEIMANDLRYDVCIMIHEYRTKQQINQREFAKYMGVTQSMVSKWESGDYNFSLEQLAKICSKLGCEPKLTFSFDEVLIASKFDFLDFRDSISLDSVKSLEEAA